MKATAPELPPLTEDAYLGLDGALSYWQIALEDAVHSGGADPETESVKDLKKCMAAARAWLMQAVRTLPTAQEEPTI
jgi:hypothetical protein